MNGFGHDLWSFPVGGVHSHFPGFHSFCVYAAHIRGQLGPLIARRPEKELQTKGILEGKCLETLQFLNLLSVGGLSGLRSG